MRIHDCSIVFRANASASRRVFALFARAFLGGLTCQFTNKHLCCIVVHFIDALCFENQEGAGIRAYSDGQIAAGFRAEPQAMHASARVRAKRWGGNLNWFPGGLGRASLCA